MRFTKSILIISIVILIALFAWNNLFVSEQVRIVEPFDAIYTSGPVNVFIQQAEEESVRVRADDNLHDKLEVEVVDGELKIYTKQHIHRERVLSVYVDVIQLNAIHADGASTLTGRGLFNTNKLNVKATGAAEIKLQLSSDSLDLDMHDAANVQLAGTTRAFHVAIHAFGDLLAYKLISQSCKVEMDTGEQSPGYARINVEKTLDVTIKGPRHLHYRGGATITNQLIERGGKIIRH